MSKTDKVLLQVSDIRKIRHGLPAPIAALLEVIYTNRPDVVKHYLWTLSQIITHVQGEKPGFKAETGSGDAVLIGADHFSNDQAWKDCLERRLKAQSRHGRSLINDIEEYIGIDWLQMDNRDSNRYDLLTGVSHDRLADCLKYFDVLDEFFYHEFSHDQNFEQARRERRHQISLVRGTFRSRFAGVLRRLVERIEE